MILGEVTPNREAIIRLTVIGPNGEQDEVEAILDTGLTESLTLSPAQIASLRLPLWDAADFILANGASARLRVFRAEVLWHGGPIGVLIVEAEGGPLVGMALLHGSRVTLDVVDGGPVTIAPIG
jgi:predicted aspartyl protease